MSRGKFPFHSHFAVRIPARPKIKILPRRLAAGEIFLLDGQQLRHFLALGGAGLLRRIAQRHQAGYAHALRQLQQLAQLLFLKDAQHHAAQPQLMGCQLKGRCRNTAAKFCQRSPLLVLKLPSRS